MNRRQTWAPSSAPSSAPSNAPQYDDYPQQDDHYDQYPPHPVPRPQQPMRQPQPQQPQQSQQPMRQPLLGRMASKPQSMGLRQPDAPAPLRSETPVIAPAPAKVCKELPANFERDYFSIEKKKVYILCGVVLVALVIMFFIGYASKEGYATRSSFGYSYETQTLAFSSSADRAIAEAEVVKKLASSGKPYSKEDVAAVKLPSNVLISFLETDDEDDEVIWKAKIVAWLDPTFRQVQALARATIVNGTPLPEDARRAIYSILVMYFTSTNSTRMRPIKIPPFSEWKDKALAASLLNWSMPRI